MGEILQCPTFFTPRLLFTQRIKCLTCHMLPSEAILLLMYSRKRTKKRERDSTVIGVREAAVIYFLTFTNVDKLGAKTLIF